MQLTIVSFPRSGQHLTERLLSFYCKKQGIKFSYCEFYTHCRKTPCKSKRLFQKNHDFDLKLPIDFSNRYLVLYRSNMIEQLEAWFRYDLGAPWGLQHTPGVINYDNSEKRSALLSFVEKDQKWMGRSRGNYYVDFIKKWVMCSNKNIFKLEYGSFLKDTKMILPALKHMLPDADHTKDDKIISSFCKLEPIKRQTKVDLSFN